ncbi:MAG: prolipoprotein diacylglyceryl transferase [Calditrichaceae bacterium]
MIEWNVNPEIFHIGFISIRYYSLLFMLSFILGIAIFHGVYKRENKPKEDLDPLLIYMMLGTVIGARLGHCLFYDPSYYLSNPIKILKVWEGGLASHGAAIGILLSLYLYSRKHPDQPFLWLVDRIVITVALAGFFIRMGNLFNSEIIGKPTDVPWAFKFIRAQVPDPLTPRHPTQIYEFCGLKSRRMNCLRRRRLRRRSSILNCVMPELSGIQVLFPMDLHFRGNDILGDFFYCISFRNFIMYANNFRLLEKNAPIFSFILIINQVSILASE